MAHPFDLSIEEVKEIGEEIFAIDAPAFLDGSVEALSTDCGNTLSTVLCDCAGTLSTLFCLSSNVGSG
ncbi:hypothetical protein [Ruegeria sp. SCP11]|uniref:hypothetical protein n=1 Tax=Ruegeria sp. SCP11 TaxID=3141378 RepID=UPI00333A8462